MVLAIYEDWDIVLRNVILTQPEVISMYKKTRIDGGGRIPLVILDDVTTLFPKQLWFASKALYMGLQQFIATVRERFAVILVTTPDLQNLITPFRVDMKFECLVNPNSTYVVERYARSVNPYYAETQYNKLLVEYSSFNLRDEPYSVFKEYDARRWEITEEIVKKLEANIDLENIEKATEDASWKAAKEKFVQFAPVVNDILFDKFRTKLGIKFDDHKARALLNAFREQWLGNMQQEKPKLEMSE